MAHSVAEHLRVKIADYDRFIRTVIPNYDTMRGVQLDLLARCLPRGGRVLDLGGGTGALAARSRRNSPKCASKSGTPIPGCSKSRAGAARSLASA